MAVNQMTQSLYATTTHHMKSIKVIYNGKRLKDIYPYATKFQVFKYRLGRLIRKIIILSTTLAMLFGVIQIARYYFPVTFYKADAQVITLDTLTPKVNSLKDQIIDNIKEWETKGLPAPQCNGKIIFDTNKKASVGCFQFQVTTVIHYVKIIEGRDINEAEAIAIAIDYDKARELAYKIVWEQNGLKSNWYNYSQLSETKTNLAIINKLTK